MFKKGMWLEAVDSHDSQLVCPAIVVAKMSPYVIKIRFFGWDEKYDQWKSIESEEVFPMGWCQLVNYPLAPPGPNYPGRFQGCDSPGNGRIQVKKNIPIQKGTKRKLVIADNSSRSTSVSSEDHGSVSSASSGISDRKKLSRF
ncbi:unnamed protein product [Allacma fusca]|uniref:Uncharacterized protein n=1 Tax=Allacma fusca TaxID=39272 RepID=A0A8J2KXW2_9HEXA|nr:unnamed protein product [Allacma fusca]